MTPAIHQLVECLRSARDAADIREYDSNIEAAKAALRSAVKAGDAGLAVEVSEFIDGHLRHILHEGSEAWS